MKQLLILSFLIFTSYSFTQKIYFSLGSGYNFGMAEETLDHLGFENSDYDVVTTVMSQRNQIYVSLGKGFSSSGTIGYEIIPGVAIEFSTNYTLGQSFNSTINYHQFINTPTYLIRRQSIQANSWLFGPAIRYNVTFGKVDLYARCQFLMLNARIQYSWEHEPQPSYQGMFNYIDYKLEYFGGLGYGAGASLGASYQFGKRWSIFAEARINSVSYAPTKGTYTYYESNGVDIVNEMTYRERNISFVDNINPAYPYDEQEPQERLRISYPFSSIGIQAGVSFSLNTAKKRKSEEKN